MHCYTLHQVIKLSIESCNWQCSGAHGWHREEVKVHLQINSKYSLLNLNSKAIIWKWQLRSEINTLYKHPNSYPLISSLLFEVRRLDAPTPTSTCLCVPLRDKALSTLDSHAKYEYGWGLSPAGISHRPDTNKCHHRLQIVRRIFLWLPNSCIFFWKLDYKYDWRDMNEWERANLSHLQPFQGRVA